LGVDGIGGRQLADEWGRAAATMAELRALAQAALVAPDAAVVRGAAAALIARGAASAKPAEGGSPAA
jgi:hypothetical protein